ncbi:hypothetical protein GWI33_010077, partial [Rhynchophorus ferrugineus]
MSAVSGHYAQRVLSTIFLVSLGIYLFLATVTYTPFDPGWMHVSSDTQQVSNASGVAGAWVADMLYGLFGWAALLLPLFLVIEAIQVWWSRSYLTRPFRYAAQFFIILTTASLFYLLWQVPNDTLMNASGGIVGYEVAQSLESVLTHIGAIIFLFVFWLALWTLAFKIEWHKTGQLVRKIPDYLQDLFYRNVPPEAEDFDLSLGQQNHKLKPSMNNAQTSHALEDEVQEHTAKFDLYDELPEADQKIQEKILEETSKDDELRKLEEKIVTQPNRNSQTEKVTQTIVGSGEVWRAVEEKPMLQESVEKQNSTVSNSVNDQASIRPE